MSKNPWDKPDSPAFMHAAHMAELGVVAASMLHELRQPLFAVRAMTQLGQRAGGLDEAGLAALLGQIDTLQDVIDSYSQFGAAQERPVLFDFNDPVRNALEMLRHRRDVAGVRLDLVLAGAFLPVRARPTAAQQVVVNLLANAYDAVEAASGGDVSVHTWVDEDWVHLSVRDRGVGVPPELRGREFEAFVSSKGPDRGTGLGLYIAQRLVAEAAGNLSIAAREQGGTRVDVMLPRVA